MIKSILAVVIFCAMIMLLLYGMIAEVELRELKADRMAYNRILAERALAEYHANKEAHSSKLIALRKIRKSSSLQLTAYSYQLSAGEGNEP